MGGVMAMIKIAYAAPAGMRRELAALGVSGDDGVQDQEWWGSE
jgi:hypothetical protein